MPRSLTFSARVWAALSFATLCSLRQVTTWTDPLNRFLYHWQRSDAASLAGSVVLLALATLAADHLSRQPGRRAFRRVIRWGFVLLLGQVALSNILRVTPESVGVPAAAAALSLAGLTAIGLRRNEGRVIWFHAQVCLVLSPLPLVLLAQMSSWKPWPSCDTRTSSPPPSHPGLPPIFVFIFDDWSPSRSRVASQFEPWLPHLNHLAGSASMFLDARSPGTQTLEAMPQILFQESGRIQVGDGTVQWVVKPPRISRDQGLFDVSRQLGYSNRFLGFYLPYAALLGDRLDYCRTFPHVPKPVGIVRRMVTALESNLQYLPDPLSQATWARLYARAYSRNWFTLNARLRQEVLQTIRSSPAGSMTLVHFPLPHGPFIFEADGRFAGPYAGRRMDGTERDYERQLKFLDLVIGEFEDALVTEHVFERALVVVTSDHSWRADPDPARRTPRAVRHVPLLIKWPGQAGGRIVSDPVCLTSLSAYLQAAANGRTEREAEVATTEVSATEECH